MRPEAMTPRKRPRPIHFADLFDDLGTDELRYSAAARDLSGHAVRIEGFLSHAHGPRLHRCRWSISPASAPTARRFRPP